MTRPDRTSADSGAAVTVQLRALQDQKDQALASAQYIKDNIVVTVSGVYAAEPLRCAVDALGRDKVMFAADYPFEDAEEAGHFMDSVAVAEDLRADVAYNNAAKLLRL